MSTVDSSTKLWGLRFLLLQVLLHCTCDDGGKGHERLIFVLIDASVYSHIICVGIDLSLVPEVHITMEMGGFAPMGITEVIPVCEEAEELNGLPIGRIGRRILHVVSQ